MDWANAGSIDSAGKPLSLFAKTAHKDTAEGEGGFRDIKESK